MKLGKRANIIIWLIEIFRIKTLILVMHVAFCNDLLMTGDSEYNSKIQSCFISNLVKSRSPDKNRLLE